MAGRRDDLERQQAQLAQVARDSAILDSRLEKLCNDHGFDPAPRRDALARGWAVAFYRRQRGHKVLVHRINPEEFL